MAFADMTVREFLSDLGARKPAPGGGAAGALAGALGAACALMVENFTAEPVGIPSGTLTSLVDRCLELADRDAVAFGAVAAAYAMPRATADAKAARQAAIQAALRAAAAAPQDLADAALQVLRQTVPLAEKGNRNVLSDVVVAAQLAEAALAAAATNVRVNLALIRDKAFSEEAEGRLSATLAAAAGLRQQAESLIAGRS